jgi:N-acetylmuramoyl-L-alanine amidase
MKIVIDAGHGGTDPGAVGSHGLTESATNLIICTELSQLLQEEYGWSTLLTRTSEVFISLGSRCEIANDWGANYFVSVHCNSNGPSAHGIETLYKTDKGRALAEPVQKSLIDVTREHDRGLKHRTDLHVLNGTRMPAILVEVGFISHPATEQKLMTLDYLTLLSDAIALGLKEFIGGDGGVHG